MKGQAAEVSPCTSLLAVKIIATRCRYRRVCICFAERVRRPSFFVISARTPRSQGLCEGLRRRSLLGRDFASLPAAERGLQAARDRVAARPDNAW